MITDRTSADVAYADILRKKIQAGNTLTNEEKAIFERGTCTINMLNRIENKQTELKNILNAYAYRVNIYNKTWEYTDIFAYSDYIRLLNNLDELKTAFCVFSSTPPAPVYMYGYQEANDIEKILVDIEKMIDDMRNRFRQCGTFQCGEANEK